jgi:short-subunit dehydrogenase
MARSKETLTTVAITGASSGLGAALAREYAVPGRTLGLFGRNLERLEAVAEECRKKGAVVETGVFDVTDTAAVKRELGGFADRHTIDLLIANAGVFTGHGADRAMESLEEIQWLIRTNLDGVVITIDAVLPTMQARRAGRIAIVSSLAGLHPLADAPGYSASKAGILSYGEALREFLVDDNVAVTLVCPGRIETQITAMQEGKTSLQISPAQAAARTKRGLDKGRSLIYFPRRLYWLIMLGRLAPWDARAFFGRSQRFHVVKPDAVGQSSSENYDA